MNGDCRGRTAAVRRSITACRARVGRRPRNGPVARGPGCGWRALTAGNMASATIGDAVHAPCPELTVSRPSVPALALPRVAVRHGVALAVIGLAALSLLGPSAPTYDPWAWIIWGREIVHLDLSTVDGPSWKPLPVAAHDAVRALRRPRPGPLAASSRARGCSPGVVVIFRLGRRLGGLPAGFAAAVPYALAWWTLRNGAMGSSEGLLVALILARGRAPPRRSAARRLPARASAPRSCAPRSGRSSASTGCGCCGASRACAASSSRATSPCPRSGSCRSGGARATRCGRCIAPRTRARTARRSPTTRSARCSSSSTR